MLPERKPTSKTPSVLPLKSVRAVSPPSLWLYLAGLCVTLSGLYAVWSDVDSGVYRAATLLLATAGCGFSFLARRLQIPLRSLRIIAVSGIVFLFVSALATRHGLDALLPAEALNDRSKACLILIAWGATLLTFLLNSDAAVLFSCVPSMSMIALVSTLSPDAPMQNVFLVFVGAATFLMVHENYLRTQGSGAMEQSAAAQKLLRGQMQLAALCVIGSLTLAMLAVIPIRIVGQTLFLPSAVAALNGQNRLPHLSPLSGGNEHSDTLDIATGPVTPGDQLIMRVEAPKGLYWRGATFDQYTGSSFINTESREAGATIPLTPSKSASPSAEFEGETLTGDQMTSDPNLSTFDVPVSALELPDAEAQNSHEITQIITMENSRSMQIYGAGRIAQVRLPEREISYNVSGSLAMCGPQPTGRIYTVVSRLPDDDPAHLRAASSERSDIPDAIAARYLRINAANPYLIELTEQITEHCSNNYDRAVAIQTYISEHCKYNMQTPRAARDQDIVEYFLRSSKEGYCDSFAASMTVLCRYAGIPARLATGFLFGDYDAQSHAYTVREKHRHAWTEVFFPRIGWVTFDATSGASDISDYPAKSNKKPVSFWHWLLSNGVLPPSVGMACVGILGLIARNELRAGRNRPRRLKNKPALRAIRDRKIAASYSSACRVLRRRGLNRLATMTPDEYAAWLQDRLAAESPGILPPLQILTKLYAASCYGSRAMTEAEAMQAKAASAQIICLLRKVKRLPARPVESV